MKKISKMIIGTPSGDILISKIIKGVAYYQYGKPIDKKAFKHNPKALTMEFEDQELLAKIPQNF